MAGLRVLLAEARERERRQRFLVQASTLVGSSLDYEPTLALVARLAVPLIADCCLVHVLAPDGTAAFAEAVHEDTALQQTLRDLLGERPDGPWARPSPLRTGEPELEADLPESPADPADPGALLENALGLGSRASAPLKARGRVVGALTLGTARGGRRLGAEDLALLEDVALRAATAVDNALIHREARDTNRLKDEFLATLAHQLRTPLNAILGWAHVLGAGGLDTGRAQAALETIERNARAQDQLITEMLDRSSSQPGRTALVLKPVVVASVVESALYMVRPGADAKRVRLQLVVDPVVQSVQGDTDRLQQIFWSVLTAAIVAAPPGGRVVARVEEQEGHVLVTVEGTGGTAEPAGPRQGLELAIVQHYVELHGGTLQVHVLPEGEGFRLRVLLPAATPIPEAEPAGSRRAASGRARAEDGAPELAGVHVLVVDDDEDARGLLTLLLERRGARVTAAASADEAVAALTREAPDVLLSDLDMPGEDGYALIERVRALPPSQGGKVPAAALTGLARAEDRVHVLKAGFQSHVPKPVHPTELASVVASLAGRA